MEIQDTTEVAAKDRLWLLSQQRALPDLLIFTLALRIIPTAGSSLNPRI